MNDLISRQAAIKTAIEWYDTHFRDGESVAGLATGLKNLPSAQPERKKGEWINRSLNILYPAWERYTCSVCGKHSDNYDYCPNCGADMRGGV